MRRVVLWAFVVAALGLAAWGVVTWTSPSTQCRGVEMGPGDVCQYSSYTDTLTTRTQTYEERVATARQSAPVVVALGLAAAGFGLHVALRTPAGTGGVRPRETSVRRPDGPPRTE